MPTDRHMARRLWLPWRNRSRETVAWLFDRLPSTPTGDDPISQAVGCLVLVLFLPILIPLAVLTPIWLLECVLQWVLTPFALALRALGWVDVPVRVGVGGGHRDESVRGWRAAREYVERLRATPDVITQPDGWGSAHERGWEPVPRPEQRH